MKEYLKKPLSEKWLKAAVVGSLWATVEIVLGSLLHNLKIPFAGSILSFITVYLAISFFQIWKINGLIWRAGLICALMKSISPSAIIFGPMIGILSQAIILDLSIRTFGKNPFSYILGGAFAVFSAIAQKAITLLVLYGWDFVLLLENMYVFAAKQVGIDKLPPAALLAGISMIYLFGGALAGWLGFSAGKFYLRNRFNAKFHQPIKAHGQSDLFKHTRKGDHSIILLFVSFVVLIAGMLVISKIEVWISAIFVSVIVLSAYFRYSGNMRYLKKPAIWLQLGAIVILSAIFKNGFEQLFSLEGFTIGLTMCLRALLLLTCFAVISAELKNPVVKNLLYNKGFQNLYQSVELAFSALPGIMNEFYSQSQSIKGFRRLTFSMLNRSQTLLDSFRKVGKNRKDVFILTGKINRGKTTLTRQIASKLRENGIIVRGFVTLSNSNDKYRNAYYIKDVITGDEAELCSTHVDKQKPNFGRFYFEEKGFKLGCDIILQSIETPTELVIVDELGPMEVNDRGWAPAIEKVVESNVCAQFWVVREKLVKVMMRKWNLGNVIVFRLEEDDISTIVNTIIERLKPINK